MKKFLPMLVLLVLCLTGCSSSSADPNKDVTIKWENGVMSYNGNVFTVDSYNGYSAKIESGQGGLVYNMEIDTATDVTSLSMNYQEILEENMTQYKGGYWYAEYLGSKLTYAREVGADTWSVCQVLTNDNSLDLCATYAEQYVSAVPLTNGQVYVDFGSFVFGNAVDIVEVRTDCALITGIAKVSQGTYDCSTPVTVIQGNKEYQLMKGSSASYDYYLYEGYLIQVAGGLDLSGYIQFK